MKDGLSDCVGDQAYTVYMKWDQVIAVSSCPIHLVWVCGFVSL